MNYIIKKKINIPIFFGTLFIYKVNEMTDLNKKFNLDASNAYDSFTFSRTNKDGCKDYIIVVNNNITNRIITHESVHLCNFIFIDNNISLDLHNDETQAYLTSWFFQKIKKFIKSKKFKNK